MKKNVDLEHKNEVERCFSHGTSKLQRSRNPSMGLVNYKNPKIAYSICQKLWSVHPVQRVNAEIYLLDEDVYEIKFRDYGTSIQISCSLTNRIKPMIGKTKLLVYGKMMPGENIYGVVQNNILIHTYYKS